MVAERVCGESGESMGSNTVVMGKIACTTVIIVTSEQDKFKFQESPNEA